MQAHGKLWLPTVSLVLGAVFKLFFTLFGVSLLGEAVSPFATLLSYTLSAAINFAALVKIADVKLFSRAVYLPFATASLSVTAGLVVRRYLESVSCNFRLATLFSIVLTGVFWMLLILASGILKTGFMRDLLNSKIKR